MAVQLQELVMALNGYLDSGTTACLQCGEVAEWRQLLAMKAGLVQPLLP